MSLIAAVLAFLFLDAPWRYILAGLLLLTDVVEIAFWLKWRKQRAITGPEGIVGAKGVATSALRLEGQVKVKGQLWRARSTSAVDEGEGVVVTGVDGLSLEVAPSSLERRVASSSGRAPDF